MTEHTTTEIVIAAERVDDDVYPTVTFQRTTPRTESMVSFVLQRDGDFVTIVTEHDAVDLSYERFKQLVDIVCGIHNGDIEVA